MPQWGRPPGARLGRQRGKGWGRPPVWEDDMRFEEIEDSDEDGLHGVELDQSGFRQKGLAGDELNFTGIDLGLSRQRQPSSESYSDGTDEEFSGGELSTGGPSNMQLMLRRKEDYLVERALERIRRAQDLGKTNVKLSQQELDALEKRNISEAPRRAPKDKKAASSRAKAIETKAGKARASGTTASSKAIEPRRRGKSNATRPNERPPPYPVMPGEAQVGAMVPPNYYGPPSRPSSSSSRTSSRNPSSQSLRQSQAYPAPYQQYPQPYPPGRYHAIPDPSRPPSVSSLPRSDPSDPSWQPRARSTSSLIQNVPDPSYYAYPPYLGHNLPPHYDPRMPPPTGRRIASGPPDVHTSQAQPPPAGYYRHPSNEVARTPPRSPEAEMSDEDSSPATDDDDDDDDDDDYEDNQGVQVEVEEQGTGYNIRTRSSTRNARARGGGPGKRGRGKK
ncbi:MAG: hypothetical protein Q9227_000800 [Pyrenula ochraceoflavens]